MEEIIDILNEEGIKTRKTISKTEAHKEGIYHNTVHLFIINKNKDKILLQKRCKTKKLFPDYWDATVGGHVSSGEEEITSLKREMSEELGLNANDYEILFIDRIKENLKNNGIICNEFVSMYIIIDNVDINNLKFQKEEVEEAKWFTKQQLNNLIKQNKVVPHYKEYKILNEYLN